MSNSTSLSVDGFKARLKKELTELGQDFGKRYDNDQERGYTFQIWVANLLLRQADIEGDGEDHIFNSGDLKIDIAFEDEETKTLYLAQTKCVSISSNPDIKEEEVNDFINRHDILYSQPEWVRKYASDELHDLVSDYKSRLDDGWDVKFYFVSTGKASDRVKALVSDYEQKKKAKFPSLNFFLLDFYGIKEAYIKA